MEPLTEAIQFLREKLSTDSTEFLMGQYVEVRREGATVALGGNKNGLVWLAETCLRLAEKGDDGPEFRLDETSGADVSEMPLVLRYQTQDEAEPDGSEVPPVATGVVRVPMQVVRIEVKQQPDFGHEQKYAGAHVDCYIKDQTAKNALFIAIWTVQASGWDLVKVERQYEVDQSSFDGEHAGNFQYYQRAMVDEEVFVFYTFGAEAAEDDFGGADGD